ncbi:MAG: hypothetical protein ACRDLP_05130 [Solirubrobacteraceae bacterium]
MPVDLVAAERFVLANARVIDRHRLAVLLHGAPVEPFLRALSAYQNDDGGFGHALEPDVRSPHSEPVSALRAIELLNEVGAPDDRMMAEAAAWVGAIALADGGVPVVMPTAAAYPHAPWMVASEGASFLTLAIAGALLEAGSREPWLERATAWSWSALARPDELSAYWVKCALAFLDAVPDESRASAALEQIRPMLGDSGSLPVAGGIEGERLTPLVLSERPRARSRALFTDEQIANDLDRLEREQQDDGGWTFDWLAWSPGQSVEWRGAITVQAVRTLITHGRIEER